MWARICNTKLHLGQQVCDAIAQLRRSKTPVSYPEVARRAAVSRTFLYENPDARTLVGEAIAKTVGQQIQARAGTVAQQEAAWRGSGRSMPRTP